MNIQVRKIANGYVISYPKIKVPTKKDREKEYERNEQQDMMRYLVWGGTSSGQQEERLEWYCSTKAQVEEAVPRIALECYHAMNLKESES
jgi:hypothetical protein